MRLIRRPLQAGPGAATDGMRLLSALSHWSQHQPAKLALKSRQGEITYRRLGKRTDGVARQLRDRGSGQARSSAFSWSDPLNQPSRSLAFSSQARHSCHWTRTNLKVESEDLWVRPRSGPS